MPDNPGKDPAGDQKVGGPGGKKKGMLTGKNKWYVVGGLGIIAVLVFFFVGRSKSNAGGTTTTTGTAMDPATQAALQSALQGQASGGGLQGQPGPTGGPGPRGPRGRRGPRGKRPPPPPPWHHNGGGGGRPPVTHRGGHSSFYTVRPGDTLSEIASRYNVRGGWTALYHSNRGIIGSNPNVIHPGQRLKV